MSTLGIPKRPRRVDQQLERSNADEHVHAIDGDHAANQHRGIHADAATIDADGNRTVSEVRFHTGN